jgi:putative adhesin
MTKDETAGGSPEPEDWSAAEERLAELVRSQDFETDGPIRIDIGNSLGPVVVELAETALTHVEVRHDPGAAGPDWRGGLTGLLSWVTEQFGEAGIRTGGDAERGRGAREPIAEAVRRTRIDLTGGRLAIRTPASSPLRNVPLAVKVRAPLDSEVGVHSSSGEVTVTGAAGRVNIQAGSGTVTIERADDRATVRSGSGQLRLGTMTGGVHARSGSGDVEIASIEAASSVATGSGNVWLGAVSGDVLVRAGSGDVTVADASAGQIELITGSGELQVSVHRGITAEVDLTSTTGTASSDLTVSDEAPEEEPKLQIFGRTGTGDAVLTTAT